MDTIQSTISRVTGSSSKKDSAPILLTGASGFIAAHILNSLLSHGHHVRGTVRSEATANKVRATHSQYSSLLTFAIVPDVASPRAFDEAVKGVSGVIHTASPFVLSVEDNEKDLLLPAITGTTNILKAITAHAPAVKRVVITSSFASIVDMDQGARPGYTYTEADWNPVTYAEAKSSESGAVAYCASKTLAEKAAWDFLAEHKPNFTLATICPPMVYGPAVHSVESLDKLNTSSADIYRLMNGSEKTVPETSFYAFVDVRDVAEAHRLAYEKEEAGGERFFVTGGGYSYQEVCDVIRKNVPEVMARTPEGTPGKGNGEVYRVDGSKAVKLLGVKYTSLEKCITDEVEEFVVLEKRLGKL